MKWYNSLNSMGVMSQVMNKKPPSKVHSATYTTPHKYAAELKPGDNGGESVAEAVRGFTANDREQAETFCKHVSLVVEKACAERNYRVAMENDNYLATYSNDETAKKVLSKKPAKQVWQDGANAALAGRGASTRSSPSPSKPPPTTPRLAATVEAAMGNRPRNMAEW